MNIAVIGAGVTGLAAVARLASQGNNVTILKKWVSRWSNESIH